MGDLRNSVNENVSAEHGESANSRLEPRRESPQAAALPELAGPDECLHQRIAIYLIEREAIQLRRRRWQDLYRSKAGAQAEGPPIEDDPDGERLASYARPRVGPAEGKASGVRRAGTWLKSLFFGT